MKKNTLPWTVSINILRARLKSNANNNYTRRRKAIVDHVLRFVGRIGAVFPFFLASRLPKLRRARITRVGLSGFSINYIVRVQTLKHQPKTKGTRQEPAAKSTVLTIIRPSNETMSASFSANYF